MSEMKKKQKKEWRVICQLERIVAKYDSKATFLAQGIQVEFHRGKNEQFRTKNGYKLQTTQGQEDQVISFKEDAFECTSSFFQNKDCSWKEKSSEFKIFK